MVQDDGFHLPSPPAVSALGAATSLLEWSGCEANKVTVAKFSKELVGYLMRCFPASDSKLDRDMMWGKFHTIRTSKDFFILWDRFLKSSTGKGGPIFLQHVTLHMFKQIIRTRYSLPECVESSQHEPLSYQERNVLRYAAGYIPRNLHKKIGHSKRTNSKQLGLCLMDMIEEDGMGKEDESEDWLALVDRGGLQHVNTRTYKFMCAVECVVKRVLSRTEKPSDLRAAMVSLIMSDKAVQREWGVVSSEWGAEEAQELLKMIVELWVRMRGFNFASAWMEEMKQKLRMTVQKSKGLRKKISS